MRSQEAEQEPYAGREIEPSRPITPGRATTTSRMAPRPGWAVAEARAAAPVQRREAPGHAPAADHAIWALMTGTASTAQYERADDIIVQCDAGTAAGDGDDVHRAARAGVAGTGGALPHLAAIQRAFGHHDVGGVRAHVGGVAAEASAAIGARAYATGDDVAFAAAPDLHTAAHEAAHVVQQRGGVRLAGGVGTAGDPYERHADAVADRVVRGESAQALLDTMAHRGAAGGPAVQRLVELSDGPAATRLRRLLGTANIDELGDISRALGRALEHVSDIQVHVGVRFSCGGEDYRLELAVRDARAIQPECEAARAHARSRAARPERGGGERSSRPEGGGGERGAGPAAPEASGGGVRVITGREISLPRLPPIQTPYGVIEAEAKITIGAQVDVGGGAAEGGGGEHAEGPSTTVEVLSDDHHGAALSVEHEGFLRERFAHDFHLLTDTYGIGYDHDGPHFHAGVESAPFALSPGAEVKFGFEALDFRDHRFHAPNLTATIDGDVSPWTAPAHGSMEIEFRWTPDWVAVGQFIAARYRDVVGALTGDGVAAAGATTGATGAVDGAVTAAELTEAGVGTTGAGTVAAAVAVPVLAAVAIVGGTLWACAEAEEEGRRDGLLTWYVHEYAAQFADGIFGQHRGHSHGAAGIPGASRYAGEGRADARTAVHGLSQAERAALRHHYGTHAALAHATAQSVAHRVGAPDIDYDVQ